MRKAVSACSILIMLLTAGIFKGSPLPAYTATDETAVDRPEDREIWHHLIRRLNLTEEQQRLLLRTTAEFKEDVVPFLRQLEECSRILRRLKTNNGDPELIRRAEQCILDSMTAIRRLFANYVQNVSRILNEEQEAALRQVVEVLLIVFDIELPSLG